MAGTPAAAADSHGHHAYPEAPAGTLVEAGTYRATGRVVRLRRAAAEAFQAMAARARVDGVRLIPISGFRSVAYQKALFTRARKKHGSVREAALWVAPPGHSEHHTGWTLDLGDESAPATDIEVGFDATPAFAWLTRHAAEHGFELSFPQGNPQGVHYEPWHWRYTGTDEPRRLFHPK